MYRLFSSCVAENCTTEGDIRLVGGSSNYEGRVEVCHNNEWGTVCMDFWDTNDGTVACRPLGFSSQVINTTASFGPGAGPIWLDDLRCSRAESIN